MSVKPSDLRKLYKALLRNGAHFSDYNFREYAVRRTRDAFRANMFEGDQEVVKKLYYDGLTNLAVLKRQTQISQMFKTDPVVVEH